MKLPKGIALVLAASSAGCAASAGPPSSADEPTAVARAALSPSSLTDSVNVALGVPVDGDPSDDYLMDKGAYVLSYNPALEVANWVAWRVESDDLGSAGRQGDFREDPALPETMYHVVPTDYVRSGYDRGHLCPSADRTSSAATNGLTFLMTNMQPQLHALNAGAWEKMEAFERELARTEGKDVYVVAGGLFSADPERIGHGVAVPDASFKIVVALDAGGGPDDVTTSTPVYAAIMPNTPDVNAVAWTEYMTTVDEIQRRSGYDFLTNVPADARRAIESARQVP